MQSVQAAQSQRAPAQRFVDWFAARYTPTVVVLAICTAVVPPLLHWGTWAHWVYTALVLLVIACPCALVLSTPVTVVSGLAAAARLGILVKGGAFLEEGRKIAVLAIDKTGTLTKGRPMVTDIVPLGRHSASDALHIAARLDANSEHPLAAAIVQACAEGHECRLEPVMDFEALVGRGVTGKLDGERYYIGNHRLTHDNNVCSDAVEAILHRLETEGKTPIILTTETESLAVLGVADTLRDESAAVIADLHSMGIRTVMLSGDHQIVAEAVAKEAGIAWVQANLLPHDKLTFIETLLSETRGAVAMVGDGINDAPALARADVGIAMGVGGTAVATETADVALLQDDLRKIPQFIRLSRATGHILWQNIAIALGIKTVVFALALAGQATLWMAVFADVGTSLIVVANGLRLTRFRG